jgi:hypothetical protein
MGRRVSRGAAESRFIESKVFLYEHSNLARLVLNRGPVENGDVRRNCGDFSEQYIAIQKARISNHLKRTEALRNRARNAVRQIARIEEAARKRGTPIEVVLIPDENQINPALQSVLIGEARMSLYDFGMPQSMLKEMFGDLGIEIIDLLPAFLEDGRCLYMNDTHWTAEGHRFAAQLIAKELKGRSGETTVPAFSSSRSTLSAPITARPTATSARPRPGWQRSPNAACALRPHTLRWPAPDPPTPPCLPRCCRAPMGW